MVSAQEVTSKEALDDLLREQNSSLLRNVLVCTVNRKTEVSEFFASEEAHLKDNTPECHCQSSIKFQKKFVLAKEV